MDAFPAFFPLSGKTVVIAGAGEPAEAKVRLFAGSPATIRRLEGAEALEPQAYAGAILAFIASPDDAFAKAAAGAARAAGLPVNAVDRPALCDFTTPAVIDRGEVVAAIGTGGASPMLATMLRHDIEAQVPEGAGRVAALFAGLQDEVRRALPEPHRRRAFLRAALTGPAAEAAARGDRAQAVRLLREALSRDEPGAGRVQFIDARGPADLLTLRAARALAAADVLVCDEGAHADILALTRRDAERTGAQSVAHLAGLTAQGLRVARLVTGPAWRSEQADLEAAGIETDVLPIAR
ncbi:MAG TPA: bifunctional precorrin-2 dehydrogenase/sirohydrochlorin ferrochelatase [Phenylobacterium sp.]|jgi:precorrin-2 dehydrogenase/sirohydrochlorin ferrochelatase|uniref:precorrin-2 dehydrogenase/sirohydrochlorin ferrochelatase family protein n=1 Tax=Phenylobacterium sp. TaxID=1871053 RepID=UPI002D26FAFC|nr:bifunctional precorrin-2 dehydrogenase/sirohydrochlorin ferrochelatase [Phenylobacterium sp.]HZZ67990.1 bifunctional precorrin-2 dehydrogenase/sirohydrochlorin ferrochelatase [Phenylobacterium sp.]